MSCRNGTDNYCSVLLPVCPKLALLSKSLIELGVIARISGFQKVEIFK